MVQRILLALLLMLSFARATAAGSIGPDCATCQGGVYSLFNLGKVNDLDTSDGELDTWQFQLVIDTSGYTGTGDRIDQVAFKVSSELDAVELASAPGGTSSWNLVGGGLNANGCSGKGSGFECANWIGNSGGALVPGAFLSWIFNVDVANGFFANPIEAGIKVRYVDEFGRKAGDLVSENITLAPEPGTLLLTGSALALVVRRMRRRRP